MPWLSLPARNLDRTELRRLVNKLAAEPDIWREHVDFSDDKRHFVSLYRDDYVDVWLLGWTRTNDTGWHDHDISAGAVRVVEGALSEGSLRMGAEPAERIVRAGRSFCFGPESIHRLTGRDERSVSIHAYSPPLWRLGQYTVDGHGVLYRVSLSYADELRPLESDVAA